MPLMSCQQTQMAFPLFRGSENCSASLIPYFQVLQYCRDHRKQPSHKPHCSYHRMMRCQAPCCGLICPRLPPSSLNRPCSTSVPQDERVVKWLERHGEESESLLATVYSLGRSLRTQLADIVPHRVVRLGHLRVPSVTRSGLSYHPQLSDR
jgi:hypothetical protein